MLEKLFRFFGWTNGQRSRFFNMVDAARTLVSGKLPTARLLAGTLAVVELFCAAAFKTPVHPYGEALDLAGYKLIMEDEFDGETLDTDVWYYRSLGYGNAGLGFNAESQVRLEDGKMIITGEYLDADRGKYGEGWYSAAVALKQWYCKGYFEIKCICNKGDAFWSAFWMQSGQSYDHELSRGGVGGAEIDILEATDYDAALPAFHNSFTQTVYCNGTDDDESIDKCQVSVTGDNIYNKFNTYGLKWTDDEYIFYVNGVESWRTSFGLGVSEVLENLIVSLEIPQELPEKIANNPAYKTEMIVDYVRVYQLAA